MERLACPHAATAERDPGEAVLGEAQEGALSGGEWTRASTACEITIQHQGLPAEDLGKELGRGRMDLRRLVPAKLVLDLRIRDRSAASKGRGAAGVRAAPTPARLIANAVAYTLGLVDQIVEELAHVAGYPVDHGEDLLEHVSDEVRGRNAKVLGEPANIFGELLGDARVKDALLAGPLPMRVATGAAGARRCITGRGIVGVRRSHESQCDSS